MSGSENLALYRLWRPQTFSEVVSQKQVVYPLRQSVRNGHFAHAFLFSGTRGTGKTSLAKIFAKAINCLNPDDGNPCNACEICLAANRGALMDIQEIDAASNNGIDDIRRLTSEIIFTPVRATYKVYIIDEAHMLSQQAFNALLKTLEEPPAHAVFILATTEPHRIPATILSRCQHYEFRRIPLPDIVARLRVIADDAERDVADDALHVIAQLASGGMRDAISLLDQALQIPVEQVTREHVLQMAGRVPDEFLHTVADAILCDHPDTLLASIQELVMSGRDLMRFTVDLSAYMRNLLICRVSERPADLIQMTADAIRDMTALARAVPVAAVSASLEALAELMSEMRYSPDLRTTLEVHLLALTAKLAAGTSSSTHEPTRTSQRAPSRSTAPSSMAPPKSETSSQAAFASAPVAYIPAPESDAVSRGEAEVPSDRTAPKEDAFPLPVAPPASEEDDPPAAAIPPVEPIPEETEAEDARPVDIDSTGDATMSASSGRPHVSERATDDDVLVIWKQALDRMMKTHSIELALTARPAEVTREGDVWTLTFAPHLKAQCDRVSDPKACELIKKVLSECTEGEVQVDVRLATDDEAEGRSAEPEWLRRVRELSAENAIPFKTEA